MSEATKHWLNCGCIAMMLLSPPLLAAQSPGSERPASNHASESRSKSNQDGMTVETGYVFIDRQYVPPPYLVRETDGQLFINDEPVGNLLERWPRRPSLVGGEPGTRTVFRERLPLEPPASDTQQEGTVNGTNNRVGDAAGGTRQFRASFGGPRPNWRPPALDRSKWLSEVLANRGAVFACRNEPVITLDIGGVLKLFKSLDTKEGDPQAVEDFLAMLPPQQDAETWREWLSSYEMPQSLETRASQVIHAANETLLEGQATADAVQRLNAAAYPLSVLGMVLSVLALGHLLHSLPKVPDEAIPGQRLRELRRSAAISTALIAALSGLDLVWTILASQTGQMQELNPLGVHLIHDPVKLAAFKVSTTLLSCGLLFGLRNHAAARTAAWWLCLVCTVLTFRWLVMNSLFVL